MAGVPARQQDNRAHKAAAILLALGNGVGSQLIRDFEDADIRAFAATASHIDRIDPETLDSLIAEFSEAMARPSPLLGGDEQARSLLSEALPADKLDQVLTGEKQAYVPVWGRFQAGSENSLVPYLLDEHPQTVAFILSQLEPALAARIVSLLPGDLRDSITRRLLKLLPISPPVSELAQEALRKDLLAETSGNLEQEGRARMAQLLNRMDKPQVDQIITSLRRERPEEAVALKKMLFSFEDLPNIEQKHRLVLFDKVQTEQVMLSLRGVADDLKEVVLSSLGARARRMIEAELANASQEVTAEVTAARQAIAQMALNLSANGDIVIPDKDEATAGGSR